LCVVLFKGTKKQLSAYFKMWSVNFCKLPSYFFKKNSLLMCCIKKAAIFLFLITILSADIIYAADSLDIKIPNISLNERIDSLNNLGKEAFHKQNYRLAGVYFKKALEDAEASGDKVRIGKLNNNVGIIEDISGNSFEALEHYQKTLSVYEEIGKRDGVEKVLNNIAVVYKELELYNDALKYFKRSLLIKENNAKKNYVSLAAAYNNIAIIYGNESINQKDSALLYLSKAKAVYEKINNKMGIGNICLNSGALYLRKSELGKADSCLESALYIFKDGRNIKGIASAYLNIARLQLQKRHYQTALSTLDSANIYEEMVKLKDVKMKIAQARSFAWEQLGNSDSALKYYKQYAAISKELFNLEKVQKIKKLESAIELKNWEVDYTILKKEKEISQLKSQKLFTLLVLSLVVFVLAIIVLAFVFQRRKTKTSIELDQAKTRLLRTQMSPHFLFNSLMSIQTFLIEGDVKGASKYLSLLARLMRLLLTYSRESFITLAQEIEISEYYLATEKLRFGDKIDYKIEVANDIDKNDILIPPLMIQPALENSIVHGLMPCNQNGKLLLKFSKKENMLKVAIEDTGVGFKSERSKSLYAKRSFSTDIIKERISLIKRRFKITITYSIEEIKSDGRDCPGTRVIFIFPQEL